jgi:hypothetical protein
MSKTSEQTEQLIKELQKLAILLNSSSVTNSRISKWSVGEHIEHLLIADEGIVKSILQADKRPQSPINLIGRIVLFIGKIPGGRKSPEAALPKKIPVEELNTKLKKLIKDLSTFNPNELRGYFHHPVFRTLNPAQALRFAVIQHQHHLRIINRLLSRS